MNLKLVSIPLWFDYNAEPIFVIFLLIWVSIPLWFDYNLFVYCRERAHTRVSIPLWFDYNSYIRCNTRRRTASLNSTMVRLQPHRHPSFRVMDRLSQFHYGSITTQRKNTLRLSKSKSQFHYGSITTVNILNKNNTLYPGLNSTMVRLQPIEGFGLNIYFSQSQFHYGSITTDYSFICYCNSICLNSTMVRLQQSICLRHLTMKKVVSIPLWFDYNLKKCFTYSLLRESLNSTMVRLQLNGEILLSVLFFGVSIPLWFDYN